MLKSPGLAIKKNTAILIMDLKATTKKGYIMNSFYKGFEKRAALASTHGVNTAQDALLGYVPFGTTVGSVAGDRPTEYNRGKEWLARVGGGVAGTLGGALLAGALTRRPGPTAAGAGIGGIVGEGVGSHLITSKYYDEKGNLKPQYRKQV